MCITALDCMVQTQGILLGNADSLDSAWYSALVWCTVCAVAQATLGITEQRQ